ncbi:MAG TPA: IS66 family transposase [Gemmataceae bacterium]|nr:IS66 family transposase [Gemmataceae bacterium]
MDAELPCPDGPLPDDVPALQALVRQLLAEVARLRAENARLFAENAELKGNLDSALRHRFGRRSERRPGRPEPAGDDEPGKRRDDHGRSPLPEHLPRREVIHDLSETQRLCPCCGKPRVCIGAQTAEQLDCEPAKFFVLRTVRRSYACVRCDPALVPAEQRIQTAGPTQVGPIPKGLCGPGLLAHVITSKFADHVPLHRLAGQLARSGVNVARSTLGGWLARAADLLNPLVALMHRRVLRSRVLHGDDTGVKLRVEGADRTRKAHLWAYIGDADFPYVAFDFTADSTKAGPGRFLEGYTGYLQADALAQYEALYESGLVKHCCCWAHARRKFVAAAEAGDARAEPALALIRRLYAVERNLPPLLLPFDEPGQEQRRRHREEQRRTARQREARPALDELEKWLDRERAGALPKSSLGQAITYARNNWAALLRYLEEGYLALDNNLSERTLRAIALGRSNWGVIGSEAGGKTAAVLYSVVATCKHLSIDPLGYLRDALVGLFALGEKPTAEQLAAWLPDRWLLERTRASPAAAS